MNLSRLNRFKSNQERLSKEINKVIKVKHHMEYSEFLPSAYEDPKTGVIKLEIPCQQQLKNSTIYPSYLKQRIFVTIVFEKKLNRLEISKLKKILKRGHEIVDKRIVTYSINPHKM